MRRELTPLDISHTPELLRLAEEVERTGQPRRLRRGGEDVAVLMPIRMRPHVADPEDIWADYDPDAVREALRESAGALEGVDRERLIADLYGQREQDSQGRPA